MKNKLISYLILAASLLPYFLFFNPQIVSAQTQSWQDLSPIVQQGREYGCVIDDVATLRGVECLLANILMVAITIIGLAGFAMMIFGSFTYLISGGNSKGIEDARKTITFAVVGLVLALSAYFILNILAQFTGISLITNFSIPQINQ